MAVWSFFWFSFSRGRSCSAQESHFPNALTVRVPDYFFTGTCASTLMYTIPINMFAHTSTISSCSSISTARRQSAQQWEHRGTYTAGMRAAQMLQWPLACTHPTAHTGTYSTWCVCSATPVSTAVTHATPVYLHSHVHAPDAASDTHILQVKGSKPSFRRRKPGLRSWS